MNKIKKIFRKMSKSVRLICMAVTLTLLAVLVIVLLVRCGSEEKKPAEVITVATLEKIVNISDISTYTAVYNGIATVFDPADAEEILYYVSYKADVKAGFDFEDIEFEVDAKSKTIIVDVPEIKMTACNVDIASLDFIFVDDDANTSTVSNEAYKACQEDVMNECDAEDTIFSLAEQNAINHLKALINPFVEQLDEKYELIFK